MRYSKSNKLKQTIFKGLFKYKKVDICFKGSFGLMNNLFVAPKIFTKITIQANCSSHLNHFQWLFLRIHFYPMCNGTFRKNLYLFGNIITLIKKFKRNRFQ